MVAPSIYDSSSGTFPRIVKSPRSLSHNPTMWLLAVLESKTRVALVFEADGCLSGISVGTSNPSLAIQVSSW